MKLSENARLTCEPDPEFPGWFRWELKERGFFNDLFSPTRGRHDGPGRGIIKCTPQRLLGNTRGNIHGGALMGFVDIALFSGAAMAGCPEAVHAVTLDCSVQFIDTATIEEPIEAAVEILRETRMVLFLRGLVTQDVRKVASFSAMIRKMPPIRV